MDNEVWIIEHAGIDPLEAPADAWNVFESKPLLSEADALTHAHELAEIHRAVLQFRVKRYVPAPER